MQFSSDGRRGPMLLQIRLGTLWLQLQGVLLLNRCY